MNLAGCEPERAQIAGDFVEALSRNGVTFQPTLPSSGASEFVQTQATTILAFKYEDGVLIAGDRRATAGNIVVYERADKVLEIDRHSVMAIAGVPATAWEMARVLEHSFHFYRRTQMQEMSVDGKVRALSKLLRDNFGFAMQGIGVVVPLFATFDDKFEHGGRLYFYDVMGAQFEVADFAASGSGSPAVKAILHYESQWGKKPLAGRSEKEAVSLALRALETAAESDTATGGVDRRSHVYPVIKTITKAGVETVSEKTLASIYEKGMP
ncbi:MAG TPA: proteasome subunit alpha [Chthoniobacterales bacterium]